MHVLNPAELLVVRWIFIFAEQLQERQCVYRCISILKINKTGAALIGRGGRGGEMCAVARTEIFRIRFGFGH